MDKKLIGELFSIPIKKPSKILLKDKRIVICSTTYYREILDEILQMGINKDNIVEHTELGI